MSEPFGRHGKRFDCGIVRVHARHGEQIGLELREERGCGESHCLRARWILGGRDRTVVQPYRCVGTACAPTSDIDPLARLQSLHLVQIRDFEVTGHADLRVGGVRFQDDRGQRCGTGGGRDRADDGTLEADRTARVSTLGLRVRQLNRGLREAAPGAVRSAQNNWLPCLQSRIGKQDSGHRFRGRKQGE